MGLGSVSLRSLDVCRRRLGMVAWAGLWISVLPSDLGAGLCFVLRPRFRTWSWVRLWLGLDRLASAWTGGLFPSLVGRVGRTLRRCRIRRLQSRRLCAAARRLAILEREPGDA